MEREGFTIQKLCDKTGLTHVTFLTARSDGKNTNCKMSILGIIAGAMGYDIKDLFEEM